MIKSTRFFLSRSLMMSQRLTKLPSFTFAKISKKQNKKQEHVKQRSETAVPKEINFNEFLTSASEIVREFEDETRQFKIGKLTPEAFNDIDVYVYGENTSITMLGQVVPINANSVSILLYDDGIKETVYKALAKNEFHEFTLAYDNDKIIATVENSNTKDKKNKMIKLLKEKMEKVKKNIKNERAVAIKNVEKLEKFVSNDIIKQSHAEIEKIYKKNVTDIENIFKNKERELNK